ncbi:hypothetical protein D3C81_1848770 [compost metagenome]
MPRRTQLVLQTAQQRQRQPADQPGSRAGAEQRLDARHDHRRQTFTGLEHDVADKAVAHHHIRLTAIQAITFDEADIVQHTRLAQ